MRWALARRLRTFADLNFLIVNVRQELTEVAHVEIGPADWAIAEIIGLGFGSPVRIATHRPVEEVKLNQGRPMAMPGQDGLTPACWDLWALQNTRTPAPGPSFCGRSSWPLGAPDKVAYAQFDISMFEDRNERPEAICPGPRR